MTVFDRIHNEIKKKKITQKELCKITNTSESTYCTWKKQNRDPDTIFLAKCAKLFNTTTDYLITGENTTTNKLTPKEELLLNYFNKSNEEGQERILEQAEFLSNKHPSNLIDSGEKEKGA